MVWIPKKLRAYIFCDYIYHCEYEYKYKCDTAIRVREYVVNNKIILFIH